MIVLDTPAFLTLSGNEPGTETVQGCLDDALAGTAALHACFVSLTEVEYTTIQRKGEDVARQRLEDMMAMPIRWHHSDDEMCSAAAKLKATHKISFADSFVAALAQRLGAILIHKDPEFAALGDVVKQQMLPLKAGPVGERNAI